MAPRSDKNNPMCAVVFRSKLSKIHQRRGMIHRGEQWLSIRQEKNEYTAVGSANRVTRSTKKEQCNSTPHLVKPELQRCKLLSRFFTIDCPSNSIFEVT